MITYCQTRTQKGLGHLRHLIEEVTEEDPRLGRRLRYQELLGKHDAYSGTSDTTATAAEATVLMSDSLEESGDLEATDIVVEDRALGIGRSILRCC